jgi:hypothetical protein
VQIWGSIPSRASELTNTSHVCHKGHNLLMRIWNFCAFSLRTNEKNNMKDEYDMHVAVSRTSPRTNILLVSSSSARNNKLLSRDGSVGMATGRTAGVRFPAEARFFFLPIASWPALGPTQPPIQWQPEGLSPGLKWLRRKAEHSPQPSAEVENGGAIPPLPHTSSWYGDK